MRIPSCLLCLICLPFTVFSTDNETTMWDGLPFPNQCRLAAAAAYHAPIFVVDDWTGFDPTMPYGPVILAPDGAPEEFSIARFSEAFGPCVGAALRASRFQPAKIDGREVESITPVSFPLFFVWQTKGDPERIAPTQIKGFPPSILDDRILVGNVEDWFIAEIEINRDGRITKVHPASKERSDRTAMEKIFRRARKEAGGAIFEAAPRTEGRSKTRRLRMYWQARIPPKSNLPISSGEVLRTETSFRIKTPETTLTRFLSRASISTDEHGDIENAYLHRPFPSGPIQPNILQLLAQYDYPPNTYLVVNYIIWPQANRIQIDSFQKSVTISAVEIKKVEPRFPRSRVQGTFLVEFIVTKEGTTRNIRVLRTPNKIYDRYLIKALKKWRYQPATRNGIPIEETISLEYSFNLRYYDPAEPEYFDGGPGI